MDIRFVFVGRICKEKWVSDILQLVSLLWAEWISNFRIDFFGDGDMVKTIQNHRLFWSHLFYHGRLPKEEIIPIRKKAHYTLMSSLFLETFGLVALDSLALWVPVIGEKKWGIAPFIIDSKVAYSWKWLFTTVKSCIEWFNQSNREILQKKALNKASEYTSIVWIDRFWQLSKNCKKFVLCSDYAVDVWWIENYLFQVITLSKKHWIIADLYWKSTCVRGLWRKTDLVVALFNIYSFFRLFNLIRHGSYELVRLHSVQRWLWWLVIVAVKLLKQRKWYEVWLMIHDFWMLHPFPSRVNEIEQLDRARFLKWYLQEWKIALWTRKRYAWWCILIFWKRLMTKRMRFWIRRTVDTLFVPSWYMILYVRDRVWQKDVLEMPHFVSHTADA
jgi:hypothetical protein